MRSQLITKDSFADDFNFRRIKTALSMTYKEGKQAKLDALNKSGPKRERDILINK